MAPFLIYTTFRTLSYNIRDGVKLNCVDLSSFNNIQIEKNNGFGMYCYDGTIFNNNNFNQINIKNNGFAEYVGHQSSFNMHNQPPSIYISDDNYGANSDQYLLMNLNWDGINKIDIRGTNIFSAVHLYPTNSLAWKYNPQPVGIDDLLTEAKIEFANGNYVESQILLYQILNDELYSQEAITAIFYLYHIEVKTQTNCGQLRVYLDSLKPDLSSSIYKVVSLVYAKTLIKDKEYLLAIEMLEEIIIDSDLPDEVIAASIDQGYAYLLLAETDIRALPKSCQMKPTSFEDYQSKITELSHNRFKTDDEESENLTNISRISSVSNYPNPFNPTTNISFNLTVDSNVEISVFNIKGQKIRTLTDEKMIAGNNNIVWNGLDQNDRKVTSGVYFYKIIADNTTSINKMILLK